MRTLSIFWCRLGVLLGVLLLICAPLRAQNVEDLPLDDPEVPAEVTPAPQNGASTRAGGEAASEDGTGNVEINDGSAGETGSSTNFLRHALLAGVAVALICSYLGLFVVARRMVFIGVALAEFSSAGIALGMLLGFKPLWGALGFMVLSVILFSRRWAPKRVPPDAVVGVFYLLASAVGVLLIAKNPHGESQMLSMMRGEIITVDPFETWEMIGVFAVIAVIHALFQKEFLLVSLDRDTASTLRFNAAFWEFLLFLTIGVAVSLSIRSVGVLLTSAMLTIPAATALLAVARWKWAALLAPVLGVLAVAIGLWFSFIQDFPASAVIVAVSFVFMAPALVWHSFVRRT